MPALNLFRFLRSRKQARRPAPGKPGRRASTFRPGIEMLEDRLTPAAVGTANQNFVEQVYLDLLQRPADGLTSNGPASFWVNLLDNGASRFQVALGIENSTEYRILQVREMFQKYLGRDADPLGLQFGVGFLQGQHSTADLEALIAGSPEFFAQAGGNNSGFLGQVYQKVLGRGLDPVGAAVWGQRLAGGTTRTDVARQILGSAEALGDQVDQDYVRFLHHHADAFGLGFWTPIDQLSGQDAVVAGILSSDEYFGGAQFNPTTLGLTSSAPVSSLGQAVHFTAAVTPVAPGQGPVSGTVQFSIDGQKFGSQVPLVNGTATSPDTSTLTANADGGALLPGAHAHVVTAAYSGDIHFNPSTATLDQLVQRGAVTTVVSSASPSDLAQPVTFTARVNPATPAPFTPTGTVQFQIDGANFGGPAALVSGVATSASTTLLSGGVHNVTAVYSGDGNFTGGSGSATHTVRPAATTTTLSSSFNPSNKNQPVTFTAAVSPARLGSFVPGGDVTFFDASTVLATVPLVNGQAAYTTSTLAPGSHPITAVYNGDNRDPNFASSTSAPLDQSVSSVQKTITTTTLQSISPNPSNLAQSVTFTAAVSPNTFGPATATGSVNFYASDNTGKHLLGAGTLQPNGTASLTVTANDPGMQFLTGGSHTIVAAYQGDAIFSNSPDSAGQTLTVNPATPSVTLTPGSSTFNVGDNTVTFNVTVTPPANTSPFQLKPGTIVDFILDQGKGAPTPEQHFPVAITVDANGVGHASLNSSLIQGGSGQTLVAVYNPNPDPNNPSPDPNFSQASSNTASLTVNPVAPTVAITNVAVGSVSATLATQSVTVTVTVSSSTNFAPSGNLTIQEGGTTLNPTSTSMSVSGTTATYNINLALGPSDHTVTAVYGGDRNFTSGGTGPNQTTTIRFVDVGFPDDTVGDESLYDEAGDTLVWP